MTAGHEQARVCLVPGGVAGGCELCNTEALGPTTSIVVRQPTGNSAQVSACVWCAHAIRRLAILTAGQATFELTGEVEAPPPTRPPVSSARRPNGSPTLIVQFPDHVRDATGHYVVRVAGRQCGDDAWEGWLEFVAVGAPTILRTLVESRHGSREDLAYWAKRLNAAYIEGAFLRAQQISG
jgi:hypothetical protein